MKGSLKRLPALSSACSLLLFPAGFLMGWSGFLLLCVLNFMTFHAIWLLPAVRGRHLTEQFFKAEMRTPLALFMICGMAGLVAHFAIAAP